MTSTTAELDQRDAIDTAAVVLMLLLTVSWGLNWVAGKVANTGYNPVFLTVARSAIAAVVVFFWCYWRRIPLFERDGTLWAGLLAGLLFGAEFVLIFAGLDYTTVARSALMVNTMPFWVLIGAHFLLGERMSLGKVAGLVLAFAGVALVF
ncbi:DMT family transporter, partial [Rhizobiaceae sp. 2RAB30]